ncbi:MAG: XRE family transcriptional regulator [Proteobacteria bacterium]|nr:MAG: XRE family transcriptional regulator [Pseudomonadota bacterium]
MVLMQPAETFEIQVRRRLKELGWTHERLASQLGIATAGVSKTLTNGTSPRIDTLVKWAEALGVSPEYLLGLELAPRVEDPSPARLATLVLQSMGVDESRLQLISFILTADETAVETLQSGVSALKSIGKAKGQTRVIGKKDSAS